MKKWIGTTRFVYNKALHHIKTTKERMNFQAMRNMFVTYESRDKIKNPNVSKWETETPKDIRAGGLQDLDAAFKSAFSNLKNNNISSFNMTYRKKKNPFSIRIPKSALKIKDSKELYLYRTFIPGYIKLSKDKILSKIEIKHDCRLLFQNNKWFLFIPYKATIKKEKIKESVCALDPGIRKFQTIYSEKSAEKIIIKKDHIEKFQTKLDLLQSLKDKKQISKNHYLRAIRRIYFKIQNCIDDMHYKVINSLIDRFKIIFLPEFENQEILKINKSKSSKRIFLSLKHYTFKQRLISKADISNCNLVICKEDFTSKTCGKCGNLKYNLGSNETYKCLECNLIIDRDINAARNILIKNLVCN